MKYEKENHSSHKDKNQQKSKGDNKTWIITFQYSDGDSSKYIIQRPHYYAAKEEVERCMEEINYDNSVDYKIVSFDIKEGRDF